MAGKQEIIQVESKVIALGEESNDMYMSLSMVFLTSAVNLNNIKFTEDFINGVANNSDKYIGSALVADISMLESGQYGKLTHKYDKTTGTFGTVGIGSFVKFYTRQNGDILELLADARVWKRNPKTCEALEELYDSDEGLKFSYEVLVATSTKEKGVTVVPEDADNNPIGSCVVSFPAVISSKCELLVAELSNNIIPIEGGENKDMARTKDTTTQEMMFKNTKVALVAELDINQVQKKIYNSLKCFIEDDWYEYDIFDMTMNYVITKKYCDASLYKIDYIVEGENVVLSNMRLVTKEYKDIQEEENMTIAELEKKVSDLNVEIAAKDLKLKEKDTEIDTNKKDAKVKDEEIDKKDKEVKAKTAEVTEANEKLTALSASVLEKDTIIAALEPIKVAHETMIAEKAAEKLVADKVALKEKFSKVLSAEVMVEMAESLESLDIAALNSKVVELAMASISDVTPKSVVATVITASTSMGKNDLTSKYITIQE